MALAIQMQDLAVSFSSRTGKVDALKGLNLEVPEGHVVGFIGPNGAGKTTAMHVLLGFVQPTKGNARIFDTDVSRSIARERIGYLPEHPQTYKFLTGRELLSMIGRLFLLKGTKLKDRIDEVLALVKLGEAADRKIATYSRGMLQRIGLAQALINNPDLVILDEPTGGLDPIGRMGVREIIAGLKEKGKTVFFSSHELSEVELACDYVAMINNGIITAQGPISDLVEKKESLEQYFLRTAAGGDGK